MSFAKAADIIFTKVKDGGLGGIRTHDPLLAKQML